MKPNKFNEGETVYFNGKAYIVIDYKPIARRGLWKYQLMGARGWIYESRLKGEYEYAECDRG